MFGDPVRNSKNFKVEKLGEIFSITSGGTPSKNKKEYWENGTIPWIGSNMCQDSLIYETDGKYITVEGLNNSSAKIYNKDSVLVALVGATIGKTALLKTATSTNQNIACIDVGPNQNFTPEFVFYWLQFQYDKFLNLGGGFKMANLSFIRNLDIIIAPHDKQQLFSKLFYQIDKSKFVQ